MNKKIINGYETQAEKLDFLQANCDAIESLGYMKPFSAEQIEKFKTELSEVSITINDIEEERKATQQHFKAQLDPLKEERKELLTAIKQKARYQKEECYKFIDQQNRVVEYYNKDGEMVSSRPMLPSEAQKTIYSIERTGTHDN
jgi:septal ring factor EnvC (AmiA/AmiB activator)